MSKKLEVQRGPYTISYTEGAEAGTVTMRRNGHLIIAGVVGSVLQECLANPDDPRLDEIMNRGEAAHARADAERAEAVVEVDAPPGTWTRVGGVELMHDQPENVRMRVRPFCG